MGPMLFTSLAFPIAIAINTLAVSYMVRLLTPTETAPAEVRSKTWNGYAVSPKLSRYSSTEKAKGYLDSLFVISADAGVSCLNELLNGCDLPIPRIEQLRFQPPEEAFRQSNQSVLSFANRCPSRRKYSIIARIGRRRRRFRCVYSLRFCVQHVETFVKN